MLLRAETGAASRIIPMTTRLLAAAENHTHTLFSSLLLLLLDGESNRSTSRKRRKSRLPKSTVVVTTTNQHFSRLLPQHTGWGAERFFFHLFSCAGCSSFLGGTSFFFSLFFPSDQSAPKLFLLLPGEGCYLCFTLKFPSTASHRWSSR